MISLHSDSTFSRTLNGNDILIRGGGNKLYYFAEKKKKKLSKSRALAA